MSLFAVEYTYSDATVPGRDVHRPAHREWLLGHVDGGFVVSSGPYPDGSGALIIVDAPDHASADSEMRNDPFQVNELVEAVRITEWKPVMGALSDR